MTMRCGSIGLVLVMLAGGARAMQPAAQETAPSIPPAAEYRAMDLPKGMDGFILPERRNAAVAYLQACLMVSREQLRQVGEVDWDNVPTRALSADQAASDQKLPESFTTAQSIVRGEWLDAVARGSMTVHCSFEVPVEEGLGVLLPHLGQMRSLARAVRVRVRSELLAGNGAEAVRWLGVGVRLGEHVARDPVLISSLVGVAIVRLMIEEAGVVLDSGVLEPADRAALDAELARLQTDDVLHMRRAIRGEREIFLGWVGKQYEDDATTAKLLSELVMFNVEVEDERTLMAASLRTMTPAQRAADMDKAHAMYDQLMRAFEQGDRAAIERLEQAVKQGEHGITASLLMPAVSKAWQSGEDLRGSIAAFRARMAKGAAAPAPR